jgi:hypothetical protein
MEEPLDGRLAGIAALRRQFMTQREYQSIRPARRWNFARLSRSMGGPRLSRAARSLGRSFRLAADIGAACADSRADADARGAADASGGPCGKASTPPLADERDLDMDVPLIAFAGE